MLIVQLKRARNGLEVEVEYVQNVLQVTGRTCDMQHATCNMFGNCNKSLDIYCKPRNEGKIKGELDRFKRT